MNDAYFTTTTSMIAFNCNPVKKAVAYQLEISLDANFATGVISKKSDKPAWQIKTEELRGVRFWRVFALDDENDPGIYARMQKFTVTEADDMPVVEDLHWSDDS